MPSAPRLTTAILIAGGLLLFASRSDTQAPVAKARSRIAILNLSEVIKGYNKFKTFQEELKKTVEPFQAKDTEMKTEGQKLAKEAQDTDTTVQRREEIEAGLKELQKRIEQNKQHAQKVVSKKQEDHLRTLYKDVHKAVKQLAKERDLDLVMHYNDGATEEEYWSPANVARKMQAGALMPIHAADGLDITKDVIATLNKASKPKEGG